MSKNLTELQRFWEKNASQQVQFFSKKRALPILFCHKSEPSKQYMSFRIIWKKIATIATLATNQELTLQGMPCQLESQVHSTNTLIDEVGLVEMEVGLDQLTWGDADLQRELRRLKDNSLKIPNLKYIFKIALLRVIPTLTHYSDIVSDISSGRICGIYVLTYYLTFFSEILFDILSGILSGIYSDILSGIYYILILPCHEFGLGVLLFAWINANGLNIPQMLVSHVCTQWLPLPLIPQNGQVLNLRVGPEKFSGYWKNRILAQGLKKDVGGRFRYAVGLQSWVNAS